MTSETIQKYKNYDTPKLRKKAKDWFHLYIRLRDSDENGYSNCISSGNPTRWGKSYHAGHYFSAGQYPSIEFNEDNVHGQSLQDNFHKHSNAPAYRVNLTKKIGAERVENLEQKVGVYNRTGYKHDRFALIEIIEKYVPKVRSMVTEKNFPIKLPTR